MGRRWCIGLLLAALALAAPAASQDGRGVIIEANPYGADSVTTFNPTFCDNPACRRVADFLFPMLFAIDPTTGAEAVVISPTLQPGDVQTFTLRSDVAWSDGTPITAYDVLFSAILNRYYHLPAWNERVGARVVDTTTIRFEFAQPDCATLPRANFPILPAHALDPDFARFVDETNAALPEIQSFNQWYDLYSQSRLPTIAAHRFNRRPTATAGVLQFETLRPGQDIRLSAGSTAFVYANLPEGLSAVDWFLAGGTNILINPPYDRRDDLRAAPGLQIAEYPGLDQDVIIFNLADPTKPKPAFDADGQPLEQGQHPLFGDARVRQAVQLAIDINEVIEIALQGSGTPTASYLPPSSWAFNADLQPTAYDLRAAEKLLYEAGWRDVTGDGVRECHGCRYAPEHTPLSFALAYSSGANRDVAANIIARQLRRAGFNVSAMEGDGAANNQRFDALLTTFTTAPFDDPDRTWQLTQAGDVPEYPQTNFGSYSNPQVETLMEQARAVPGCDPAQRANRYREIQSIVQQDQPYAFLYTRTEMVAARGILNFAPLPGQPYWNIRDWVVLP